MSLFNSPKIGSCAAALMMTVFIAGSSLAQQPASLRLPRLSDVDNYELIESARFSPDGSALSFERSRSWNSSPKNHANALVISESLTDVWVQDAPGRAPRNITNGTSDDTGAWDPSWSPDGELLVFFSTRGGGEVTLWLWERKTNKIRQVSKQGVDFAPAGVLSSADSAFYWLDSRRIICLVPKKGEASLPDRRRYFGLDQADRLASAAWERARRGELTASVVDSNTFKYTKRDLFVLDVLTGEGKRVAPTLYRHRAWADWWLSPNKKYIAHVTPTPSSYGIVSRMRMGNPYDLELREIDGKPVKLDKPLPENIHTINFKWSPDGKELAFFANGPGPINPVLLYGHQAAEVMPAEEKKVTSMENPAKLYRVNIEKKTLEQIPTGDIDRGPLGSPDFEWTSSGELVFNAPKREYGVQGGPPPSRGGQWGGGQNFTAVPVVPPPALQWWVLSRDGRSRPMVPSGSKIPTSLRPVLNGTAFAGISDGELVFVDPASGKVSRVTEKFESKVTAFTFQGKHLLLSRGSGMASSYSLFDLGTSATLPLKKPVETATLVAFSAATGSAVFSAQADEGEETIWRTFGERTVDKIGEINMFLREIMKPSRQLFEYTSLNGEKLKARLTLPYGYKKGNRYPLFVHVRAGVIVSSVRDGKLGSDASFAASGYAYMSPSIPPNINGMGRTIGGDEGDSCVNMLNGVMPAVQKLIDDGIADPDRLFVEGSSRGGWTAMCVVGLTTRFKAGIASVSDGNGNFDATSLSRGMEHRYGDNPIDTVAASGGTQKWYNPTDIPWWRDGDRMKRNNALTYVDRVQTPMLLVDGDMDHAFFEVSEQYFNALVSMRKPARFVRYWGEGHGNLTPANRIDYYRQMVAWCDRWGDIARDEHGNMIWDGDRVKSRNGALPLKPEDYAKFDLFQPSPARLRHAVAGGSQTPK